MLMPIAVNHYCILSSCLKIKMNNHCHRSATQINWSKWFVNVNDRKKEPSQSALRSLELESWTKSHSEKKVDIVSLLTTYYPWEAADCRRVPYLLIYKSKFLFIRSKRDAQKDDDDNNGNDLATCNRISSKELEVKVLSTSTKMKQTKGIYS